MTNLDENEDSNLLEFIARKMPENLVLEILSDPDTCRTFVKLFDPLTQHFLMRLLMLNQPILFLDVREWAVPGTEQQHQYAFQQLRDCYFISITQDHSGEYQIAIRPEIRDVLLYGSVKSSSSSQPTITDRKPLFSSSPGLFPVKPEKKFIPSNEVPYMDPEILEKYATNQFEKILYWMLNLVPNIDKGIKKLLKDTGLINRTDNQLTKEGHQFLLADRRSQIWRIMRSYLQRFLTDSTSTLISTVRFVLKIGSLQFTRGYPISELNEAQKQLYEPFSNLGLLMVDNGYYYPTKIALQFFGKDQYVSTDGWLLIDTNFKVTAYTTSRLNIALLRKFTIITYEMPGFTSAYISPDSFKNALAEGTSMEDILNFLKGNLIKIDSSSGSIPSNVEHQLHIWQAQRERIVTTPRCVMRTYMMEEYVREPEAISKDMMGFVAHFTIGDNHILVTLEEIEEEFERRLKALHE
ncbi:RNA polymerase II transcription factor B subunit 2 [Histomonas meleagridis]|uniref:RNA polymerase II transcription factor B subunit 2 n=1 Tax=Histomonas meleagridis TaxID=135588 RepID=UPI00355A6500|nr:RNA polymerase II transcription factor B subunit 2 [Histomonas meleagridis]KAH0805348.1 RNA polymerase II transcription factor B subunit 2 [Histomonas meleagridis]